MERDGAGPTRVVDEVVSEYTQKTCEEPTLRDRLGAARDAFT